WKGRWQVQEASTRHVTLRYEYREAAWPWPYLARQRFELDDEGLALEISVHNRSDRAMPAGLGWHPYFPKPDARLVGRLGRRWAVDRATLAPTPDHNRESVDWREPQPAEALRLDDVFEAGSAEIEVLTVAHRVTLRAGEPFGF